MKTGKVSQILGKDPKTILNWTANLGHEFMSPGAMQAGGATQRDYTEADILVLNTVKKFKNDGVGSWEEVKRELRTGFRDIALPAGMALIDTGETNAVVYGRALQLQYENERLLDDLATAQEQITRLQERDKEREQEIRELYLRIGMLKGALKSNGIDFSED